MSPYSKLPETPQQNPPPTKSYVCRVHPIELPPRTPRVEHLLRTGAPPLPLESANMMRLSQELPRQVDVINQYLVQMHRAIDILHYARMRMIRDYEDFGKIYQRPQPYIHHFPPEVMQKIFAYRIFEDMESEDYTPLHPFSSHWRILNVCQRWAYIMRTTPWFWTLVRIRLQGSGSGGNKRVEQESRLLMHQLFYARNKALDVIITGKGFVTSEHPVLKVLLSSSSYWRTLYLDVSVPTLKSFAPIEGNLRSLTELKLIVQGKIPSKKGFIDIIDTFATAPLLQHVEIEGRHDITPYLRVPPKQLTNYFTHGIKRPHNSDHFAALRNCQNLRQFAVRCEEFPKKVNESLHTAVELKHSGLLHLCLTAATGADMGRFLSALTLPSLTHLDLFIQRGEARLAKLASFLKRSNAPIANFQLRLGDQVSFEDEELKSVLEYTPLVTAFFFKLPRMLPPCVVDALDFRRHERPILPKLQYVIESCSTARGIPMSKYHENMATAMLTRFMLYFVLDPDDDSQTDDSFDGVPAIVRQTLLKFPCNKVERLRGIIFQVPKEMMLGDKPNISKFLVDRGFNFGYFVNDDLEDVETPGFTPGMNLTTRIQLTDRGFVDV